MEKWPWRIGRLACSTISAYSGGGSSTVASSRRGEVNNKGAGTVLMLGKEWTGQDYPLRLSCGEDHDRGDGNAKACIKQPR
jgi:hypothetical protein